jgi:hypothetical protein
VWLTIATRISMGVRSLAGVTPSTVLEPRVDVAAVLGDADAEHRDQHDARAAGTT